MKNPYRTLGVNPDAGDDAIHQAYLQKIRENPPERDQARFQAVRQAYETVSTHRRRLQFELFHADPPELTELLEVALQTGVARRPTVQLMRQLLRGTIPANPAPDTNAEGEGQP